jgi:hypothetical protein
MAMEEQDDRQRAATREGEDVERNKALARYDAHPDIAVVVLAVMAFLFIVVVYQFASDRVDNAALSPRDVAVDPTKNSLIGLAAFSSDGKNVGRVESVDGEPDGRITAINITTGGFLGLGPKLVAIPEGKYTQAGGTVRLGLTAEEVGNLPEVKAGS